MESTLVTILGKNKFTTSVLAEHTNRGIEEVVGLKVRALIWKQ